MKNKLIYLITSTLLLCSFSGYTQSYEETVAWIKEKISKKDIYSITVTMVNSKNEIINNTTVSFDNDNLIVLVYEHDDYQRLSVKNKYLIPFNKIIRMDTRHMAFNYGTIYEIGDFYEIYTYGNEISVLDNYRTLFNTSSIGYFSFGSEIDLNFTDRALKAFRHLADLNAKLFPKEIF